ncbi:MAG: hypothetical protein MI922_10695, partial [Bacteroidales bacterium]|nr:hypothetical protein [Bacteroidales bacterium]
IINQINYDDWKLTRSELAQISYKELSRFSFFIRILQLYASKVKEHANIFLFKAERLLDLYPIYQRSQYNDNILWLALVRDIKGVYNSQKKTVIPGTNHPMSKSVVKTSMFWRRYARKCHLYSKQQKIEVLKYEDVISGNNQLLNNILVSKYHITSYNLLQENKRYWIQLPVSHQKIHGNINKGPQTYLIEQWKKGLSKYELNTIYLICKKELRYFKYVCFYTNLFPTFIKIAPLVIFEITRRIITFIRFKTNHILTK